MNKRNLLLLILISQLIFGCSVDNEFGNLNNEIFANFKKMEQVYTLTSNELDTIIGKEGTKIIIDRNSLEFGDGTEVSGTLIIKLTEYYKKSDIVLANLSTSSNDNLLVTGGMINISASSNNKEVFIKNHKTISIEFSSKKNDNMEVFFGTFNNGFINWTPETKQIIKNKAGLFSQEDYSNFLLNDTAQLKSVNEADSIFHNNVLTSSKFGWINCDHFLEIKDLVNITIDYDTSFYPSAYLIFTDINSIMPCNYKKSERIFINLPKNYKATLIAFCVKNKKTYISNKDIVIGNERNIKIDFNEIPMEEIKSIIDKFN